MDNGIIHVGIDGYIQTNMAIPTACMRNWTENPVRASFAEQYRIQGTI